MLLERGEENIITRLTPAQAVAKIMKQILIPENEAGVIKTFDLVDKMLKDTNLWRLACNISVEAATKAFNAMHGGNYED
ncbi:MAG: hypothetical protein J6C61_01145 [Clostridia bacterium]|nr:hypothetical protein [Clostridia bacterium]